MTLFKTLDVIIKLHQYDNLFLYLLISSLKSMASWFILFLILVFNFDTDSFFLKKSLIRKWEVTRKIIIYWMRI